MIYPCVQSREAGSENLRLATNRKLLDVVFKLVAALFGFGGIAAGAVTIGKILFVLFLILFVVSLLLGIGRRGRA